MIMVTRKGINPEEYLKKSSTVSALTKNTKKSAEDNADGKKKEAKTERTTVLFRKSSWQDFCTLAHLMDRTPNDMLNDYLDRVTEANAELIRKHREETEANKLKVKDVL